MAGFACVWPLLRCWPFPTALRGPIQISETVTGVNTEVTDVVVGKWMDGRMGVMRGIRKGPYEFGITLFGAKAVLQSGPQPQTVQQ